jgi:hypothetical protein
MLTTVGAGHRVLVAGTRDLLPAARERTGRWLETTRSRELLPSHDGGCELLCQRVLVGERPGGCVHVDHRHWASRVVLAVVALAESAA